MWNPETHPFRVIRRSLGRCPSWRSDRVATFATEAEARAAFAQPMTGREVEVALARADNAATWDRNGRWTTLTTRHRS